MLSNRQFFKLNSLLSLNNESKKTYVTLTTAQMDKKTKIHIKKSILAHGIKSCVNSEMFPISFLWYLWLKTKKNHYRSSGFPFSSNFPVFKHNKPCTYEFHAEFTIIYICFFSIMLSLTSHLRCVTYTVYDLNLGRQLLAFISVLKFPHLF